MQNAAIRLLGLNTPEIDKQAEEIIFGQLRQVIASMRIEDINRDREKFLQHIQHSLEPELKKIGLVLINVNITDITDESRLHRRHRPEGGFAGHSAGPRRRGRAGEAGRNPRGRGRARQGRFRSPMPRKLREIGTREASREQAVRIAKLEKEQTVGEQTAVFETRRPGQASPSRQMRIASRRGERQGRRRRKPGRRPQIAALAGRVAGQKGRSLPARRIAQARSRGGRARNPEPRHGQSRAGRGRTRRGRTPGRSSKRRPKPKRPGSSSKPKPKPRSAASKPKARPTAIYRQARSRGPRQLRNPGQEGRRLAADHRRLRRRQAGLPIADARALSTTWPRPAPRRSRTSSSTRSIVWENGSQNGHSQHRQLPAEAWPARCRR